MFGFGNCGLRNEIESLIHDLCDTGQCSTNWTNKPTGSWSFWTRSIFFRPYFHYYLSGFRCCKDRIQFQLLSRSLHIWFTYIHNHRFIIYRDYYEPTWWPACRFFLAFLWLMFGALNLRWKGAGLSSGRDSLFYSAWELDVNFFILKITDMIGWKLKNLRWTLSSAK